MFYFLNITDEDGDNVLNHVANYPDDTIHIDHPDVPQNEWRKAHHLTKWVKENKPKWKIVQNEISYSALLKL